MSAVQTVRQVRACSPRTKIVVELSHPELTADLLSAGADAVYSPDLTPQQLSESCLALHWAHLLEARPG